MDELAREEAELMGAAGAAAAHLTLAAPAAALAGTSKQSLKLLRRLVKLRLLISLSPRLLPRWQVLVSRVLKLVRRPVKYGS